MPQSDIFKRVLTVGPDIKGFGGISAVLQSYSRTLPYFTYTSSNSRYGTLAGLFPLALTLAKMPIYRLRGFKTLHVHSATGKSYIRKRFILKWGQALGFRTIFHCHGGSFPAYAEAAGRDRIVAFLNSCDAVAVLSKGWKKYFSGTLGCKRVFVVDNIIEPPQIPAVRKPHASGDTVTLVFFGRITKEKGFFDLVEALELLKSDYGDRMRIIIGGDADADTFNADMKARGLDRIIEYAGWVRGEAKDRILRRADVVILPSYIEGIPITLLEAGVYRMPSIATTVGGIPEIISDGVNGQLIPPGKPEAIAAAIKNYLDSPELIDAHGKAGAENIVRYLPDTVIDELRELYMAIDRD